MPKPVQASTYTFRDIIQGGFLYVDKTRYLYELVRYNKGIYFLSRPRRFGKSLTVSTLEEIFKGNKALFAGLWLHESDYDWQTYPVLHLDFSVNTVKDAAMLEKVIDTYTEEFADAYGVNIRGFDYQSRFRSLLLQLSQKKQVVILIDEYDKPILDHIGNLEEAKRVRDTLKAFYTVIKAMDAYVRFVFITGISKFSKVGVFSTLNNLTDLTLNPAFANVLGITEAELQTYFAEHIAALAVKEGLGEADLFAKIKQWYDGFRFTERAENVYNPYSTLLLFFHQRFANYWFESGTPNFLIELLKTRKYDVRQLEQLDLSELAFSTYELENLAIVPLLFQTGYLTIQGYEPNRQIYQLGYPNQEVENAFVTYILDAFSRVGHGLSESYLWQLVDALQAQQLTAFFDILNVFFANIDYDLYLDHEKYHQTIFYLIFLLLGIRVAAEVKTNRGRIDAVIELTERIYLFEFKLSGSAVAALKQIQETEYYQKYRLQNKALTLVGVRFDRKKRKVTAWKFEMR